MISLEINEIYYYIRKKVRIIEFYLEVNLVKICVLDTLEEMLIDASGITRTPVIEQSISIKLLGGISY